jgi:hypothetical protein
MSAVLFLLPPLALAVVLLLWRMEVLPRALRRPAAVAVLAAPYAAGALMLLGFGGGGLLHVRLDGFVYELEAGRGEPRVLAVGASPADDLRIDDPAYAADTFRVAADGDGLAVTPGAGWDGRQVVRVNGAYPGLVPLQDGAVLEIADASGASHRLTLRQGGAAGSRVALVTAGGEDRPLPRAGRGLPALFQPGPRERVYPLSEILAGAGGEGPGPPLRSLLLFPGGEGGEVNAVALLPLDPTVRVDGREVAAFPVDLGDRDAVVFEALRGAPTRLATVLAIAEVERFSHRVGFRLAEPREVVVPLPDEGERLVVSGGVDFASQDRIVRFAGLPESLTRTVASLELRGDGVRVESPHGLLGEVGFGRPVELGSRDGLTVVVHRGAARTRPVGLLLLTGLAVAALAAPWHRRPGSVALLGAVAFLTVARLLFGWAASQLPPFSRESLLLALWALPAVPAVVLAADAFGRWSGSRREAGRRELWSALALAAFAVLAAVPELGRLSPGLALGAALPLAAALALPLAALLAPAAGRWSPERLERFLVPPDERRLFAAAFLVYGVRLAAALAGWREAVIAGGTRFALSVLYVPALVVLLALGCARLSTLLAERGGVSRPAPAAVERRVRTLVVYLVTVLALHAATGAMATDLGIAIYLLPAALALAGLGWEGYRLLGRREGRAWTLGLVAPLLVIAVGLAVPMAVLRAGEVVLDRDLGVRRLADPEAVVRERKLLRLLQYLDPARLPEIGTRDAEGVAQHLAVMDTYAQRGVFGEGFMAVPVVPAFRQTALNDNAAAVYVFGQFGLLGALAMILAYGTLLVPVLPPSRARSWAPIQARDPAPAPAAPLERPVPVGPIGAGGAAAAAAGSAALLAALVFAGGSLYILAANAQLLPFTGRNLYLLGLNGLSDVYEGGLLLALVAWGSARAEAAA